MRRRGMLWLALGVLMLVFVLVGVTAWARGEASATPRPMTEGNSEALLPGRQAAASTPAPDGWRITGGVEIRRGDDGTWRIDLDFWLRAEAGSTATPVVPAATDTPTTAPPSTSTPTMTPSNTPLPTNTPRPTNTATPSPTSTATSSPTPIATAPQEPTATQEHACVVRSTANVNARTLPVVRSDTAIGVLPADSQVRITGYYLEHTGDAIYTWYRYWFDVDHSGAWSRADFFTERNDTPGCQLLPRVTEP